MRTILAVLLFMGITSAKIGIIYDYEGSDDCGATGTSEPFRYSVDRVSFQDAYLGECVGPNEFGVYQIADCSGSVGSLRMWYDPCCAGPADFPAAGNLSTGCFPDTDSSPDAEEELTSSKYECADEEPMINGDFPVYYRFEESGDCGATGSNMIGEYRVITQPAVCAWKNSSSDPRNAQKTMCDFVNVTFYEYNPPTCDEAPISTSSIASGTCVPHSGGSRSDYYCCDKCAPPAGTEFWNETMMVNATCGSTTTTGTTSGNGTTTAATTTGASTTTTGGTTGSGTTGNGTTTASATSTTTDAGAASTVFVSSAALLVALLALF